jgi:hypothetical protein
MLTSMVITVESSRRQRSAAEKSARLRLRPAKFHPQPPDQRQQALTALRILYTDRLREAA